MLLIFLTAFHMVLSPPSNVSHHFFLMLISMISLSKLLPSFNFIDNSKSMSLKETKHLSYGIVSMISVIFLKLKGLPLSFLNFYSWPRWLIPPGTFKFCSACPEHVLAGRGGRWPRNFFGIYWRSVEIKPCCGQLTKWVTDSGLELECKGLTPEPLLDTGEGARLVLGILWSWLLEASL